MPEDHAHLPKNWPRRVRASVLTAISLAHLAIARARGQSINSSIQRVRLSADNDALVTENTTLREELRIHKARMETIPAGSRPHYPPVERMAILELRAACGWSANETARHFLVSPATISEWMSRLEEQGKDALVQTLAPVNKYPEFVGHLVRKLKALCPTMGKARIAGHLARAGLHLAETTVGRLLKKSPETPPAGVSAPADQAADEKPSSGRTVTAKRPDHVWHVDLTVVPIAQFWVPWLPFCLPQIWPFCWWVQAVTDHFSRRVMKLGVFKKEPTARQVTDALDRAIKAAGAKPKHAIFDKGPQFFCAEFKAWCKRRNIKPRFGAVGNHGSIAIVERLIRSFKTECTRRLALVPMLFGKMVAEIELYADWFNEFRPHEALGGRTPNEVYFSRRPANTRPRHEPRSKWPRRSKCAAPKAKIRGPCGVRIELVTTFMANRKHLPIVRLKRIA
jgi:putative transposase